jgi:hypothetical protein
MKFPFYAFLFLFVFINLKNGYTQGSDTFNTSRGDDIAIDINTLSPTEACMVGNREAAHVHKRGFLNFALGLTVIGVLPVSLTQPKLPDPYKISDYRLLENEDYIACYRKSAKKKNVEWVIGGAITSIVGFLFFSEFN